MKNLGLVTGFLAIVKHKSFSRAAEELFISQSCLSKQMKTLEEDLGVKLFDKNMGRISLTEAGKEFLDFSVKLVNEYYEMLDSISKYSQKHSGEIKVGSIQIMSNYDISTQFVSFQAAHRNTHMSIVLREQQTLKSMIDDGTLDCAVIRIDHLDMDRYEAIPLVQDELVLVCPQDHPFSRSSSISMNQLANQQLVSLNQQSELYHIVMKTCKKYHFQPEFSFIASNHLHLLKMVSLNLGMALLPSKLVEYSEENKITTVRLEEEIISTIGLVRIRKNKFVSPAAAEMWTYFKKKYADVEMGEAQACSY